jgi:hypothetical protein
VAGRSPGAQADRRSNSANALDEDALETIKERVETLSRDAEKLIAKGGAKTKSESDQAADLADQLRKLEVKAEGRRKALHEPHKAEIKKLDGQWNPVRDMAESAKRRLESARRDAVPLLAGKRPRRSAASKFSRRERSTRPPPS